MDVLVESFTIGDAEMQQKKVESFEQMYRNAESIFI